MDRRFSLAAVIAILIAGAIYLWLQPEQAPSPAPSPAPTPTTVTPVAPPQPNHPARKAPYVLAVTWFEGFCEMEPAIPECLHSTTAQQTNFALHGLWPGNEYCAVPDSVRNLDEAGRWDRLPPVELSDAIWRALKAAMPGTVSHLERHEWVTHGTCSGVAADTYFRRAAELAAAINSSEVRKLFMDNRSDTITGEQIRAAFDTSFGRGAGKRMRVNCERLDGHDTITELTVNIYGDIFGPTPLKQLIAAGRSRSPGCDEGLVNR